MTDYAKPPQMPSILIKKKTRTMLAPFLSTGKNPTADSKVRETRTSACKIAGRDRSLCGSGGMPNDIEEREKKTVV